MEVANSIWQPPEECYLHTVLVTVLIYGKRGTVIDVTEAEVSHEWGTGKAIYTKGGIQLTPTNGYKVVAWAPLPYPCEVSKDEINKFRREITDVAD